MLKKPLIEEYPEYYHFYIDPLPDLGILAFLENQTNEILEIYKNISEEKLSFRYAEGKWSIIELLGHLLDSEIIMGYRALTYARKDETNLPMYDHDEYVKLGNFGLIDSNQLIEQYASVRKSNLLLFKSFPDEAWVETGITGGKKFTTRTIPYILAGHTKHHLKVLKEKYLC